MQAPVGTEDRLIWFYRDVIGLEPVETEASSANVWCFRSDRVELRIRVSDCPDVERIACRAVFQVPSLDDAAACLREHDYPFVERRGLSFTDRCLMLFEPGGNRIELRTLWPQSLY